MRRCMALTTMERLVSLVSPLTSARLAGAEDGSSGNSSSGSENSSSTAVAGAAPEMDKIVTFNALEDQEKTVEKHLQNA